MSRADLENGPDDWEPEGGFDFEFPKPITSGSLRNDGWWEAVYSFPTEPVNITMDN